MDTSTWAAVWIGAGFITLTLLVFAGSLVPPATRARCLAAGREELASWPDQWRELRADVRSWWHHNGRHATGAPVHDRIECGCELAADDAPARDYSHDPGCNTLHEGPAACPPPRVEPDDVQVISDDSATQVLPAVPERTDEGATEGWSPKAEVEAVETHAAGITAAHTVPDLDEMTLLSRFDAIVEEMRAVPKELVAFAATVDEAMETAKMDGSLHKRWRATAFDVPTGEYRLALASA